jgi:hypothetical protein
MSLWRRASLHLQVIRHQQAEIEDLKRGFLNYQLAYTRNARDLLAKFLCITEDEEVRRQLIAGVMDLGDEIARLEEHAL